MIDDVSMINISYGDIIVNNMSFRHYMHLFAML